MNYRRLTGSKTFILDLVELRKSKWRINYPYKPDKSVGEKNPHLMEVSLYEIETVIPVTMLYYP
jgi:hypothetical protein